jgi:hypothetical protein
MDKFEPQGRDPDHESDEGCLIWQLGAEGCRARATVTSLVVNSVRSAGPASPMTVISYVRMAPGSHLAFCC